MTASSSGNVIPKLETGTESRRPDVDCSQLADQAGSQPDRVTAGLGGITRPGLGELTGPNDDKLTRPGTVS